MTTTTSPRYLQGPPNCFFSSCAESVLANAERVGEEEKDRRKKEEENPKTICISFSSVVPLIRLLHHPSAATLFWYSLRLLRCCIAGRRLASSLTVTGCIMRKGDERGTHYLCETERLRGERTGRCHTDSKWADCAQIRRQDRRRAAKLRGDIVLSFRVTEMKEAIIAAARIIMARENIPPVLINQFSPSRSSGRVFVPRAEEKGGRTIFAVVPFLPSSFSPRSDVWSNFSSANH